jgi:hypothetical protein
MRRALAALAALAGPAAAQEACVVNGADICAHARRVQAEAAKSLPQVVNQNMTWMQLVALGPTIVSTVRWHMTQAELASRIAANGTTREKLAADMQAMTARTACSSSLAPFIRAGGRARYVYQTTDGFTIAEPTVTNCP